MAGRGDDAERVRRDIRRAQVLDLLPPASVVWGMNPMVIASRSKMFET